LRAHVGASVTVRGWVVTTRSSGKIAFVVLRDGSGVVQGVLSKKEVADDVWQRFGALSHEASVALTGTVREEPRSPGGYELALSGLELLGPVRTSRSPPKSMGRPTSSSIDTCGSAAAGRWRSRGCGTKSSRPSGTSFYQEGFTLVDTPILTGAIGEEAGNLFATDYFDLGKAYLAQTGQLYVEAAAAALGKVYCFGPTFRAEKSKTRRHLTEFWMVEPEVAFNDSDANMRLQEAVRQLRGGPGARPPQGRIERAGARHLATRAGAPCRSPESPTPMPSPGSTSSARTSPGAPTSAATTRPSWPGSTIGRVRVQLPEEVKAFYMKENPADPGRCSTTIAWRRRLRRDHRRIAARGRL
jgi:asparaginyl-tRNA synthetase